MSEPKNVLLITADQWRGDCLSALGHPCVKTPHLDRLAADGVLFRRHYAQTVPCGPSRASLLTGMYLQNHRSVANGTPLDRRHTNIALEARKAGYEPVLIGYTDTSADPRDLAAGDPALSRYESVLPGMTPVIWITDENLPWVADLEAKGYDIPPGHHGVFRPRADTSAANERGSTFAPALYKAEDSMTAFLTDEAIKYTAVRRDRPWFLHLSYLSPHPPFVAPEPYNALYEPDAVPGLLRRDDMELEAAQHPWLAYRIPVQGGAGPTAGLKQGRTPDLPEHHQRQIRATYYGMISEVDAQLGRLIAALEEQGVYERTLIVFTTDHGEQLGDHWLYGKLGYFEQSYHIPLILRAPGTPPGGDVTAFTESVDVMPTVLDWLGLEAPSQCDGQSLLPLSRGERPANWREEAHWEYDFRDLMHRRSERALGLTPDQCSLNVIRGERYKYVHFTALPPLFFDLQEDPGEFTNLADDPAYLPLVLEYAQKMLSWRMLHDERVLANQMLTPGGRIEHRGPRS